MDISGAAYGGRMIARESDGRVVFIDGGIRGERIRAELSKEKDRFAEARAVAIVDRAASRIAPPCSYFGENGSIRGAVPMSGGLRGQRSACGGCNYQHVEYSEQLLLKQAIVSDLVHRQGGMPGADVRHTIPSPSPWSYRNRARWYIDDTGSPSYRQRASERLMAIDQCHIIDRALQDVLHQLSRDEWREDLAALVEEITVRVAQPWQSPSSPDVALPVVLMALHPLPDARRRDLRVLASAIGQAIPIVEGIISAPLVRDGGGRGVGLWGARFFDATFGGFRYRLSPMTFFQVNESAASLMVDYVLASLGPLSGQTILDVYSGAGTFSFPLAVQAHQVLAIENDAGAIDDMLTSSKLNGFTNVHMIPGNAAEELAGLPIRAADAAVVDPPREGLDEAVIAELARIDVQTVVYVSCDPATLARDLRRFGERDFILDHIQPIDLFPQTYHIESIAVLTKAKS